MRNIYKIFVIAFILSLFFVLFIPISVLAATCNARQLASSAPFWGDDSRQNVSAAISTSVKVSGIGSGSGNTATTDEASCIGKTAEFQIFKESTLITTGSGAIQSAGIVSGRQKFYINWTVPGNFQAGDYKVKLSKVDGQNVSTNLSGNLLQVGTAQNCVFDGAPTVSPLTVNPFGSANTNINITVSVKPAQGASASVCDGWVVNGRILFDQPRSEISNLGNRSVVAGARTVQFTWDSRGKNPGIYRFKASMGTQNIESQQFFLEGSNTHKECRNNACVVVTGPGSDQCSTNANCVSRPASGSSGYTFEIPNPIGISTFEDLVGVIGKWIFNLAIPIAVIIIIYAGVLMLTSGGDPKLFQKGTAALKWAVIGLAIIFIGKGFVSLIKSILSLRNG